MKINSKYGSKNFILILLYLIYFMLYSFSKHFRLEFGFYILNLFITPTLSPRL